MPQPPCHDDSEDFRCISLGVLDGCFCLLRELAKRRELWLMKDYGAGSSWILLTSIMDRMLGGILDCVLPLRYKEDGKGVLVMELRRGNVELSVYNCERRTFKDLSKLSGARNKWIAATTYVESLISPNANNGTSEIASRNEEESSGEGQSVQIIAERSRGFIFRPFLSITKTL